MDEPQPVSPRQRLQQLLAIPDRQRTDAEWDELNELEIMLASANREGAPQPGNRPPGAAPAGRPGGPRHGPNRNQPGKKFRRRPPRDRTP